MEGPCSMRFEVLTGRGVGRPLSWGWPEDGARASAQKPETTGATESHVEEAREAGSPACPCRHVKHLLHTRHKEFALVYEGPSSLVMGKEASSFLNKSFKRQNQLNSQECLLGGCEG